MAYEDLTTEELRDILRDRELKVSGTKDELIDRLTEDDREEVHEENVKDLKQAQEAHLTVIEAEIEALLDEVPDLGDGSHAHIVSIRSSLQGLRDAQRAWRHITESPATAGAARG